jgi:Uma2 family endonuclease
VFTRAKFRDADSQEPYQTLDVDCSARGRYGEGVTPSVTLKRWKRAEYDRLVDLGAFRGDPVELIDGQLVVAEPQGSYHVTAVGTADDVLRAVLPAGWIVRTQAPLALDDESAPEPDLVVVSGTRAAYRDAHPRRPALAIEVADSSLDFDRHHKGSLYARAGVADYWIVNLVDRVLEVYRDPGLDPSAPFGWRYQSVETLAPPAIVRPLVIPLAPIRVADLLP